MRVEGINVRSSWGNYLFIVDDVVIYRTQMLGYAVDCFESCMYDLMQNNRND